jgi:uncharacterized protein
LDIPTVSVDYSVATLWRYPVKSMQGEELDAAGITAGGLLGDRRFAVIDSATGMLANAKNPRRWPRFYSYRAAYTEPPRAGSALPAVRITTPGGTSATTDEAFLPRLLSEALGREVILSGPLPAETAEEYPIADDQAASLDLPSRTSFDSATGFAENDWVGRKIANGEHVRLRVTMGTDRCNLPTLAQADLPKDSRILRTAARYNNMQVGVYAEVISGGPVRRGEPITVL